MHELINDITSNIYELLKQHKNKLSPPILSAGYLKANGLFNHCKTWPKPETINSFMKAFFEYLKAEGKPYDEKWINNLIHTEGVDFKQYDNVIIFAEKIVLKPDGSPRNKPGS